MINWVLSLLLISLIGVALTLGLSTASHGSQWQDQQSYAQALLQSAVAQVAAAPYSTTGYSLTVNNPLHYSLTCVVENYAADKTPTFSAQYPNSGLQEVAFTVALPDSGSQTVVTTAIYKTSTP